MITCQVDTRSFNRKLEEYAAASGKAMKDVVKEMGKSVVKQLFLLTPPSGQSNKGAKAKKALSDRISRDILGNPVPSGNAVCQWSAKHQKMFVIDKSRQQIPGMFVAVNRIPKGVAATEPRSHLSKFGMKRGKNAHYRKWHGERPVAKLAEVKKLVRTKQEKVGRLAAGWNSAAASVGYKPPAWISRHGTGEGSSMYMLSGWRYMATYTNSVPYSQEHMKTIAGFALMYAENGIKRQTDYLKKKLLKGA